MRILAAMPARLAAGLQTLGAPPGRVGLKSRDTDHPLLCAVLSSSSDSISRSATAPQLAQYSSGSIRPPKMSKRMPASVLRRSK